MDPRKELDELTKTLKAKYSAYQLRGAENMTAAEADELQELSARITLLKSALARADRNAESLKSIGTLDPGTRETPGPAYDGVGAYAETPKGFLTPESVKATARTAASRGVKALIAEGSSATPVSLDTAPVRKGMANLGLLSLLPVQARETAKYGYLAQTERVNNAAVVAPGATKPTSQYAAANVDNELLVFAHLSEYVDTYLLQDNVNLSAFLDAELRLGLFRKVTKEGVNALVSASGIQTQAFSGSAADSLYLGKSAVESLGYDTSFIIVPRATFNAIRLDKDANDNYKSSGVFEGGVENGIWGATTLISDDVPAGKALIVGAGAAGISTDKAGVVTQWDAISHFATNEVRARTEGRFAFDVFRPEAIALVSTAA